MIDSNSIELVMGFHGDEWLDVVVNVANHRELARRYTKDVVHAIYRDLLARFQEIVDDKSAVVYTQPGQIRISRLLLAGMGFSKTRACIEHLLRHVTSGQTPQDLTSLAALETNVVCSGGMYGIRLLHIPASEAKMHLTVARQALEAAENNRLVFSRQPILNINDRSEILYQECLARLLVADVDSVMPPASFMPSIEHVGLASEFDRIVVRAIIDKLGSSDDVSLGCNISARSAVEAGWWLPLLDTLEKRPDIAERLVIEITENAPLIPARARSFARRLRALGCRIAIDDFGVGYGVRTGIEIGCPDIVKIDASFLRLARTGIRGIRRLCGLATLARDLANVVVVEGVEDEGDLGLVHRAGCEWVQGFLLSRPTEPERISSPDAMS